MSDPGQKQPPPRRAPRRRRVALALAAAAIAVYLLLPAFSTSEWLRSRVESALAAASGKLVHLEHLAVGYDLGVHLSGLALGEHEQPPFVVADRVTARLSLAGLFSGQPIALQLERPRLLTDHLPRASAGNGPTSLPFRRIDLQNGYLITAADEIGPITVSVDLTRAAEDATVSVEVDPRLPPLSVTAAIVAVDGPLRLDDVRLSWRDVPMALLAERFALLPAGATVEGTLDIGGEAAGGLDSLTGDGTLTIRDWRYRGDGFEVAGEVTAPFVLDGTGLVFSDPGIRIADPTFAGAGVTGAAMQMTLAGKLARETALVRASATLSIAGVAAHDAAFERVIEKLAVAGTLDATWSSDAVPALRFDLSIPGGELLWDRFYADIDRHPLKLAGEFRGGSGSAEITKLDASAAGIGTLRGEALLRATGLERFAGHVEATDLGNLYALAIREPYKEIFSFLSTSAIRGKLSARVDYATDARGFALSGHLRLADVSATLVEPALELHGLQLDLPLRLGRVPAADTTEAGALEIGGMRLGNVSIGGTKADLQVRRNVVELAQPVAVDLLGGTVHLSRFIAEELTSPEMRAAFAVSVQAVDLEELTMASGLPLLRGSLSASIPRITVAGGQVRSEGEIRIHALGGNITVRNLSVDQLFSSVPTLGLDLDLDDISLGELTKAFEVGHISGVARGGARNLAIVNGEALSFDAWLESVERPGVSQRISVSAIRQLSIFGGSGSDPFSQGILALFDEYRYSALGFRCRLENDRFLLRGVETIDGKEYIVVGSFLPPRVNVVSHTQEISYSEMVRRLQRVTAVSSRGDEGEQP